MCTSSEQETTAPFFEQAALSSNLLNSFSYCIFKDAFTILIF